VLSCAALCAGLRRALVFLPMQRQVARVAKRQSSQVCEVADQVTRTTDAVLQTGNQARLNGHAQLARRVLWLASWPDGISVTHRKVLQTLDDRRHLMMKTLLQCILEARKLTGAACTLAVCLECFGQFCATAAQSQMYIT